MGLETRQVKLVQANVAEIDVTGYRETIFFSTVDGQLCQWIELDLTCREGWRKLIAIEIRSADRSARRTVALRRGDFIIRCYAPARWPDPPDANAELTLTCEGRTTVGTLTIGTHRPWTLYLLSDCCADDTWAYGDLEQHDRDDCRTTLAELVASEDNCYNYPSVYQIARFCRYATPEQKDALRQAFQTGRFFLSPVPNQLLCAAFTLSAYPLLLEPYKHWRAELELGEHQVAAYHMETPTWTNGLANLFACAGFRTFGKSLLRFLAPWIDVLETLPTLMRLEVAPDRYVYLVLRCNTYSEGFPLLAGQPQLNRVLHQEIIPRYLEQGGEYPLSAIPVVGLYSDLSPELPDYAAVKVAVVGEYNAQDWEYPRLVNATWEGLAAHVERELGVGDGPTLSRSKGLRTVRGGSGASWEAWMAAALAEAARFRRAQRDVISLRTLDAMLGGDDPAVCQTIQGAVLEVVELGDHAWNGSSEASKRLNLAIRRDRLARIEGSVAAVRSAFRGEAGRGGGQRVGVVNTLGWARTCPLYLPGDLVGEAAHLLDPETGETLPLYRQGDRFSASVPQVPGFGFVELEVRPGALSDGVRPSLDEWPLEAQRMRPLLIVGEQEMDAQGEWAKSSCGRWDIGPFSVAARGMPSLAGDGLELELTVEGTPPEQSYELRWLFELPWGEVIWRGESGGGFVTPGPTDQGGDSLLGVVGSIFACGEGLSAADPDSEGCIDFAFDHTGLCGLGGRMTRVAQGTYGERLDEAVVKLSVWDSPRTPARLELYLLGNKQNDREALLDQGGARRWRVRCGLRRRAGSFDDAALYRFACGFNHPAELVDPALWDRGQVSSTAFDPSSGRGCSARRAWLAVQGDSGILPLGAYREGEAVHLDLYNALPKEAAFTLAGWALEGRTIQRADMLGRVKGECPDGQVVVGAMAYLKVVLR